MGERPEGWDLRIRLWVSLAVGLLTLLVGLPPLAFYVVFVRSRLGTLVVGFGLLTAVVATWIWLTAVIQIDDGLEALWLPFITLFGTPIGLVLEFALLRPISRRIWPQLEGARRGWKS